MIIQISFYIQTISWLLEQIFIIGKDLAYRGDFQKIKALLIIELFSKFPSRFWVKVYGTNAAIIQFKRKIININTALTLIYYFHPTQKLITSTQMKPFPT